VKGSVRSKAEKQENALVGSDDEGGKRGRKGRHEYSKKKIRGSVTCIKKKKPRLAKRETPAMKERGRTGVVVHLKSAVPT